MYNKYEYNFTKDTEMKINIDCFEKTTVVNKIDEIFNNINSKFIEAEAKEAKEAEAKAKPVMTSSRSSRSSKYKSF